MPPPVQQEYSVQLEYIRVQNWYFLTARWTHIFPKNFLCIFLFWRYNLLEYVCCSESATRLITQFEDTSIKLLEYTWGYLRHILTIVVNSQASIAMAPEGCWRTTRIWLSSLQKQGPWRTPVNRADEIHNFFHAFSRSQIDLFVHLTRLNFWILIKIQPNPWHFIKNYCKRHPNSTEPLWNSLKPPNSWDLHVQQLQHCRTHRPWHCPLSISAAGRLWKVRTGGDHCTSEPAKSWGLSRCSGSMLVRDGNGGFLICSNGLPFGKLT